METYKTVSGFEYYAVSSLGNVMSLRSKKLLKQEKCNASIDGNRYKRVTFSSDSVIKRFSVHRLVAEAFIPNPFNKPHVNHIDNDPSNNSVSNLEWVTHSENMLHCVASGRSTYSSAAKRTVEVKRQKKEATLIKKLGSNFVSINTGERSTVTYKCDECSEKYTVRIDSSALFKPRTLCRTCAYKLR